MKQRKLHCLLKINYLSKVSLHDQNSLFLNFLFIYCSKAEATLELRLDELRNQFQDREAASARELHELRERNRMLQTEIATLREGSVLPEIANWTPISRTVMILCVLSFMLYPFLLSVVSYFF